MRIIELKSSNIKKLKAVELKIDANKNVIYLTGKNGQGKTSVIDSIWYALGGGKISKEKPIRDGEEKGEVEIDLDDYKVKRIFTEKGSYLTVTNHEGNKYSNPQEFLDYIIGNLSFDPLEFSRMDRRKQVEELTKIVGIDLNEYEEKKKELTQERLLVGREMKTIGQVSEKELEDAKNSSVEDVDIAEINDRYDKAVETTNQYYSLLDFKKNTEDEIKKLQEKLKETNQMIQAIEKEGLPDPESIKKEWNDALEKAGMKSKYQCIIERDKKYKEKEKEYNDLTEKIKAIDQEKAKKTSEVKMPIDGLSWEEDTVYYQGIPYSQASSAEQLRVSMAIAMASNPKLKVILIRDGSLLDKDNAKVIEEIAKDKDFQVWLEKVDDSGKVGIYIEDGEVKKIN